MNKRLGLPSFLGDLSEGFRRRAYAFFSGWMDLRLALGILEQLGGRQMALYFSHRAALEDFRDARAGISGISALRAGMFRDVRYGGMAGRMAQTSEMSQARISDDGVGLAQRQLRFFASLGFLFAAGGDAFRFRRKLRRRWMRSMAAIPTPPFRLPAACSRRGRIIRWDICSKPKRFGGSDTARRAKSSTAWWTPGNAASFPKTKLISPWPTRKSGGRNAAGEIGKRGDACLRGNGIRA